MRNERRAALRLGPGLITGACNDDPSSVATYSQIGAQFGFALAWTVPFSLPLLVAIQEISARIARVTGRGIAGNLRRHCPGWLAAVLVTLLALANLFNLAADLGAMAAVLRLLLAARLGSTGLDTAHLRAEPTRPRTVPEYRLPPVPAPAITAPALDPASWLEPLAGRPLAFRTTGQAQPLILEPLNGIFDERYVVYWRVLERPAQPDAV